MKSPDPIPAALTGVDALERQGLVAPGDRDALEAVAAEFRVRITPAMAGA